LGARDGAKRPTLALEPDIGKASPKSRMDAPMTGVAL